MWEQYSCPYCAAAYSLCSCQKEWEENLWRYYRCDMCGVKAGTKCDCVPLSTWADFKLWIKGTFKWHRLLLKI